MPTHTDREGAMDVLVMVEEGPDHSSALAHVNSVPAPIHSDRPPRDVVTIYGVPSPESLALALAAAVESRRLGPPDAPDDGAGGNSPGASLGGAAVIRHLGLWSERGAVGDAAWRDVQTGQLMTRDLVIPLDVLTNTAEQLLAECGQMIRRLAAGLAMPDWPEGARRAISFSLTSAPELTAAAQARLDSLLDTLREADGLAYDSDGD